MTDDEHDLLDEIEDTILGKRYERALRGPFCRSCRGVRTRNPSKTCTECLVKSGRACPRCHGTGVGDAGKEHMACRVCPGTGLKENNGR
jgi:hypothetical protein